MDTSSSARARPVAAAALAVALSLAGCATPRGLVATQEAFDTTATYSRTYPAADVRTCEAARRALLSQGYIIGTSTSDQVRGRKSFQPASDSHAEIEFTVVCAREGYAGKRTIAFVNAVQENFSVRKSSTSASVGVSPFGSVSLPFTGSDESLVKVGSQTIANARFYDRFFQLVERYLEGDPGQFFVPEPTAAASAPSGGVPSGPASPSSAPATPRAVATTPQAAASDAHPAP